MKRWRIVPVLLCLAFAACAHEPAPAPSLVQPTSWEALKRLGVEKDDVFSAAVIIKGSASDREMLRRRLGKSPEEIFRGTESTLKVRSSLPVTIWLLPDGKRVKEMEIVLRKEPIGFFENWLGGWWSLESFYEANSKTIYLSLADARDGILAHEFTHHILCQTGAAREEQEKWAHYVEEKISHYY